jgi:hypothetical protein
MVYPSLAEIRDANTGAVVSGPPDQVVGSSPYEPGDDTYVEFWSYSNAPTDFIHNGLAYFDAIDLTASLAVQLVLRISGQLGAGGDQVGIGVALNHPASPMGYPGFELWSPGDDWGPGRAHPVGEIVELSYTLSSTALGILRDEGLVAQMVTWGAGTGETHLGMRVHEAAIVVTSLSPCYDTLQTLGPVPPLIPSGSAYVGLGTYENRQVTDLSVNFTATSTDTSASAIDSLTIATSTDGLTFNTVASSGSVTVPNDGVPHDFSVPLSLAVTADDATAALSQAGFSYLLFGPASSSIDVTAASVRAGHKCYIAPANLRLYPRNNATRLYPRRRTRRPGTF